MTTRGHHGLLFEVAPAPPVGGIISRLDFTALADGSPVVDDTGKSWSFVTAGGVSEVLDGALRTSGGGYITTPDDPDWDFGSDEWVVEAKLQMVSSPPERPILGKWAAGGYTYFFGFGSSGQQVMYLETNTGSHFLNGSLAIPLDTDLYMAWYRRTGSDPGHYMSFGGFVYPLSDRGNFSNTSTDITTGALSYAAGGLDMKLAQL